MRPWMGVVLSLAAIGCGGPDGDSASPASPAPERSYTDTGHPISSPTTDTEVIAREDELTSLTNDYRVSRGLNALVDDAALRKVARAHSEHMILHAFFDHINPEGDQPWQRAAAAGIVWTAFGENLAGGQGTASEAFAALLASPRHKQVIDDPDWSHLGCGYAEDAGSALVHYWTQNFKRE